MSCPRYESTEIRLSEREGGYTVSETDEGFSVPVVSDPEDIRKGLMHRTDVGQGMLFAFETPRTPSFWMKNTLVPLDMEFLDANLNIVDAHRNVQPGDLTLRRPKKRCALYSKDPRLSCAGRDPASCACAAERTYGQAQGSPGAFHLRL